MWVRMMVCAVKSWWILKPSCEPGRYGPSPLSPRVSRPSVEETPPSPAPSSHFRSSSGSTHCLFRHLSILLTWSRHDRSIVFMLS